MLRMRKEKGQPTPALDNEPKLWPWLEDIWEAFWVLSRSRHWISLGMAGSMPGPIPFEAIYFYAERCKISSEEDFHRFVYLLGSLDEDYLNFDRTRRKEETPKKGRKR